MTDAHAQLLKLADEMQRKPSTVVQVVKRGRRVMTLISAELYESLVETLEVLGDEPTATRLRKALREAEKGRVTPWKAARRKLGIEG